MNNRSFVRKLASEYANTDDPLQWFEILYRNAPKAGVTIPWDDDRPNPNLVEFCEKHKITGKGRSALCIGCGFGHDAEYLASLGFQATGFDLAPSAIDAARKKFPGGKVRYLREDLFNLPNDSIEPHAFVLESYTLQALPAKIRQKAFPVIAALVKPGGVLLVITRGRDPKDPEGDMPYPLTKKELLHLESLGFKVVLFEDYLDKEDATLRRFRAYFRKNR